MPKPKHTLTDQDSMDLVRRSIYIKDQTAPPDYVICLAVGYSRKRDGVKNLIDAIEAFRDMLADDDWEERTLQVWDASNGIVSDVVTEEL